MYIPYKKLLIIYIMMLLKTELEQFKQNQRKNVSPKILQQLEDAIAGLKQSDHFNQRLKTGDKVGDFTLMNSEGQTVSLSVCLQQSPVVVSFFRGGWCGYDTLELQYLQKAQEAIYVYGAQVLCIAPAIPENLSIVKHEYKLTFDMLFDEHHQVAELFGVAYPIPHIVRTIYDAYDIDLTEENGDDSFRLPLPATYVINQQQEIVLDYFNPDYTQRSEPHDIIRALQSLEKC